MHRGARLTFAVLLLGAGIVASGAAADSYTYDALGRLIRVVYSAGGTLNYAYDDNGNLIKAYSTTGTTDVGPPGPAPATLFALGPAQPNPAARSAAIGYSLPADGAVRLAVFDLAGRRVRTLVAGAQSAGAHVARFDVGMLPAGVYLYRLETGTRTLTRRLVVLK